MAILDLPLQSKILRDTKETSTAIGKETQFGLGVKESQNDPLTPKRTAWQITYIPLSLVDRDTVMSFALSHGSTKFMYYTEGCTVLKKHTVRIIKDSISETRVRGKYIISFGLIKETHLL